MCVRSVQVCGARPLLSGVTVGTLHGCGAVACSFVVVLCGTLLYLHVGAVCRHAFPDISDKWRMDTPTCARRGFLQPPRESAMTAMNGTKWSSAQPFALAHTCTAAATFFDGPARDSCTSDNRQQRALPGHCVTARSGTSWSLSTKSVRTSLHSICLTRRCVSVWPLRAGCDCGRGRVNDDG